MPIYCLYIAVAVAILWKCADWFVEGAVGFAERLHVPQMLVGLVLVSMATTAPELMTSLLAAIQGMPELALGNAVGSVAVDAAVALGLAAVVSAVPLVVDPHIFRGSALVLISVIILAFLMTLDGTLSGWEGAILLGIYIVYTVITYVQVKRRRAAGIREAADAEEGLSEIESLVSRMSLGRILLLFVAGFAGVLIGSELLVRGAEGVARLLGMSPVLIGLTIAAVGTSTPEIATCVASALKRQSAIGVGNIIGADILNICWVAGVSSMANPLVVEKRVLHFMIPGVFVIVITMLAMLRYRYRLTRLHGAILIGLYVVYILVLFLYVSPMHRVAAG